MEGRQQRVRGGSWRRGGGSGGNDSESSGGEYKSRGRGGHHRGRGKRDHYRGRGRGGGAHEASFQRGQDEGAGVELEDEGMEIFSRRKLEPNWDRYEESEREEPSDDTPTQRGADYLVLLESAGDSFTQFRFTEEKEWEMDSLAASQMSAVFLDLPALAQSLQEVPLHQRLNLEAELVQVSTPVELPTMAPKQDLGKVAFNPPTTAFKGLNTSLGVSLATTSVSDNGHQGSSIAAKLPEDDIDEELDQLLSLQKPASEASENQSVSVVDEEIAASDKSPEEMKETVPEVKMEDEKEKAGPPPKAAAVKQEVTEEDLEDWLDSMIS